MLILGHIGITAGVFKAGNILTNMSSVSRLDRIKSQLGLIDYRLVLVGSLLPDLIDKPIWFIVGDSAYLSGRDYAHSLLFNLFLLFGGLILVKYKKLWLLVISLSSFMHLIFDQIWNCPVVLFWPLLGPLYKKETTGWMSGILQVLFSSPEVYVPEIIGLIIMINFVYRLIMKKKTISFLKEGIIE
ncbi:metal-dependent hydrolase [Chloroflexota bacterium]